MENEKSFLKQGLTIKSILAIAYAAILINSVRLYLSLISPAGATVGYLIAPYITLLLFSEISRLIGSRLTVQEATIIFYGTQIASSITLGMSMINHVYLKRSVYFKKFGISDKLPEWFVPPLESLPVRQRLLIHPIWVIPLLYTAILPTIFSLMIEIGATFLVSHIYIDVERLPYPMSQVDYQSIITMSVRETGKMKLFTIASIISFTYGMIVYGVPTISKSLTGVEIPTIPYPWIDLTNYIESIMPGSIFGLSTDILLFAIGWILPLKAVVSIFLGMLFTSIIGNTLAIRFQIPVFTEFRNIWTPRLPLGTVYEIASLYLWAGPSLGITLAVTIVQLILHADKMWLAIKDFIRIAKKERGQLYMNPYIVWSLIFGGGIGGFLLTRIMAPSTPWWIFFILWIIYPLFHALINTRAFAEIGLGLSIPFISESLILMSGYKDPDIWFVPAKITDTTAGMSMRIKVCLMTKTKPLDYIKAHIIAIILASIFSFLFISLLWTLTPIPSLAYPYIAVTWPVSAQRTALWASLSLNILKPELVLLFLIIGIILALTIHFLHLPLSILGFAMGFGALPPNVISYLIGSIIGVFMKKRIGVKKWNESKSVIIAGLFCGMGVAIGLIVGIIMMSKSRWAYYF